MGKFSVGDKVVYIDDRVHTPGNRYGVGTIVSAGANDWDYRVSFANERNTNIGFDEFELAFAFAAIVSEDGSVAPEFWPEDGDLHKLADQANEAMGRTVFRVIK